MENQNNNTFEQDNLNNNQEAAQAAMPQPPKPSKAKTIVSFVYI